MDFMCEYETFMDSPLLKLVHLIKNGDQSFDEISKPQYIWELLDILQESPPSSFSVIDWKTVITRIHCIYQDFNELIIDLCPLITADMPLNQLIDELRKIFLLIVGISIKGKHSQFLVDKISSMSNSDQLDLMDDIRQFTDFPSNIVNISQICNDEFISSDLFFKLSEQLCDARNCLFQLMMEKSTAEKSTEMAKNENKREILNISEKFEIERLKMRNDDLETELSEVERINEQLHKKNVELIALSYQSRYFKDEIDLLQEKIIGLIESKNENSRLKEQNENLKKCNIAIKKQLSKLEREVQENKDCHENSLKVRETEKIKQQSLQLVKLKRQIRDMTTERNELYEALKKTSEDLTVYKLKDSDPIKFSSHINTELSVEIVDESNENWGSKNLSSENVSVESAKFTSIDAENEDSWNNNEDFSLGNSPRRCNGQKKILSINEQFEYKEPLNDVKKTHPKDLLHSKNERNCSEKINSTFNIIGDQTVMEKVNPVNECIIAERICPKGHKEVFCNGSKKSRVSKNPKNAENLDFVKPMSYDQIRKNILKNSGESDNLTVTSKIKKIRDVFKLNALQPKSMSDSKLQDNHISNPQENSQKECSNIPRSEFIPVENITKAEINCEKSKKNYQKFINGSNNSSDEKWIDCGCL